MKGNTLGIRKRRIGYDARRPALVRDPSVKLTVFSESKGTEIAELTAVGNKLKDLLFEIESVISIGFDDSERLEENPNGFFSFISGAKSKIQILIRYCDKDPLPKDEGTDNLLRKVIQVLDLITPEEFLSENLENISESTIEEFLDCEPELEPENNRQLVGLSSGEMIIPIRGAKLEEISAPEADQVPRDEEDTEVLDFVEAYRKRTGTLPPSCY